MTTTQLKRTFNNALKLAVANGRTIVTHSYGNAHPECCCAVGAVMTAKDTPRREYERGVAQVLGVSHDQICAIEAGFCGWGANYGHPDLFAYGKLLAKRYLKEGGK